ncbi:unnamed protein product [Echinostoma caproni]|uniref:Replicase polyprotein 1a n=1 Tax=Echinostoma caproni TaxID=27848 RepID=A0A183B5J0_9TREM|nr:unnamed protein product [Echinostoma caproni]
MMLNLPRLFCSPTQSSLSYADMRSGGSEPLHSESGSGELVEGSSSYDQHKLPFLFNTAASSSSASAVVVSTSPRTGDLFPVHLGTLSRIRDNRLTGALLLEPERGVGSKENCHTDEDKDKEADDNSDDDDDDDDDDDSDDDDDDADAAAAAADDDDDDDDDGADAVDDDDDCDDDYDDDDDNDDAAAADDDDEADDADDDADDVAAAADDEHDDDADDDDNDDDDDGHAHPSENHELVGRMPSIENTLY